LIESASGLCLIVAPDGAEPTDVVVGRALERAWLALSAQKLAVQPMCSLIVLENILDHCADELVAALSEEKLNSFRREFRDLAPEIGSGRPAFLFRFGFAPAPTGRTGRLPIESSCAEAALTLGDKQ
jgi:hypothetical protein